MNILVFKRYFCEWAMVNGEFSDISFLTPIFIKPRDMFLTLNHQKLDIYQTSKLFVFQCYRLTKYLPSDEKFGMISQIRRASLSVHLNIAEGASRKSEAERKRYYEIARGSIVEIDAALDIALNLEYLNNTDIDILGKHMIHCFKMLTGMIDSKKTY